MSEYPRIDQPFMFMTWDEDDDYLQGNPEYWVIIASWDYTASRDTGDDSCVWNKKQWWKLGPSLWKKCYRFETRMEQLKFVQNWWANKNLDEIAAKQEVANKEY